MIIDFHQNFVRKYRKLNKKLQQKVDKSIDVFRKNSSDPHLKNHALSGRLKGKRAFSVTGDLRVIFEEHNHYVLVIMLDVGTHAQVYGE